MTKQEIQEKHGDMFAEWWGQWFDVGEGWLPIVDAALSTIKWNVKENNMPEVKIHQIKEKFGGLRIYYDGGNEKTEGIIDMATSMAERMCEKCGSINNLGKTSGWIRIICEDCAKADGKIEQFTKIENK